MPWPNFLCATRDNELLNAYQLAMARRMDHNPTDKYQVSLFILKHKLHEFVPLFTLNLSCENVYNPTRKHFEKTNTTCESTKALAYPCTARGFWPQPRGHYSENQCYSIGIFRIVPLGCVQKSPGNGLEECTGNHSATCHVLPHFNITVSRKKFIVQLK